MATNMASAASTLVAVFLTCVAVLLGLPFLILWTWLAGNPDLMYRTSMKFCRFAIRLVGIRVRVEGIENIPSGACIFAANHASNLDAPILFPAIPRRISVLAKRELFGLPVLGLGMRLAGFVAVDRAGKQAGSGVAAAVSTLKDGLSVFIFPEGTRSRDGRLQPFKTGAFVTAIEAGVPIVPVAIAGTHRLLPRDKWVVHSGQVVVRFGPAVDTSAYAANQRAKLLARVETLVGAALPLDQKPDQQPAPPVSIP
ncbi:MAG: lysophospholipid acyltransferase family protein [Candidatus Acidiferrales bacterium]